MPMYLKEDPKFRWRVLEYADPYTAAQWEQAMRNAFARTAHDQPLRLLVDRRRSSAPTPDFVRNATEFLQGHGHNVAGGRVAVVAVTKAGYGMARMTEILGHIRGVPCTIAAFRTLSDAENWLETGAALDDGS